MKAVTRFVRARPLAAVALCYALGMALGMVWMNAAWDPAGEMPGSFRALAGDAPAWVWLIAGILAPTAGVCLARKWRALVFPGALLLGAAGMVMLSLTPELPAGGRYTVEATVVSSERNEENRCTLLVSSPELNGEEAPGNMLVYIKNWQGGMPRRGDRISLSAYVFPASQSGAASPFTWRGYTLRKRVYLAASGQYSRYNLLSEGGWSLRRALDDARNSLSGVIDALYPAPQSHLVKSLVLGIRGDLPEEISGDFDTAGAVHLLALSGLHVSLLAALLERLLCCLRVPRKAAFPLTVTLLAAYALMVGAPASILRAALMYALAGLARVRKRPYDGLTGLAAAFLILTLFTPRMALDPGLLLSFSAVLGILVTSRLAGQLAPPRGTGLMPRAGRWALSSLLVSLGATLGTLPLSAAMYQCVHPYAALLNLMVIPLTSAALPLAYLSVLFGSVWLPLGAPFAFVGNTLFRGLLWSVAWGAGWSGASLRFRGWTWEITPLFALCLALASPYVHPARGRGLFRCAALAASALAAVLAVGLAGVTASPVSVTFIDVGQGDAALVRAGADRLLVDAGGGSACRAYLTEQGETVTAMALTHPHDDHAGGAAAILEEWQGVLYVPENWETMPADGDLGGIPAMAEALGWEVRRLGMGDELALDGGAAARVLWPPEDLSGDDANDMCMALLVSWGEADALLLADLPAGPEPALPEAEVLKVAHHGASNGTSALTLGQARPVLAVISVGENQYGHPDPGVVSMLEDSGAAVYRTDERGSVTVEMYPDGTLRVWTEK